jgi:hypothetical protein
MFRFGTHVVQPLAADQVDLAANKMAGQAAVVARQLGPYFAARTAPEEVLMAGLKPYYIAYYAKRRSMSFPICDAARLERFLKDYRVRAILLTTEELQQFRADGWLDGLDTLLRQGRLTPLPLPAGVPAVAYEVPKVAEGN